MGLRILPTVRRNPGFSDQSFVIVEAQRRMGAGPEEDLSWAPSDDPEVMTWAGAKAKIREEKPYECDFDVGPKTFTDLGKALAEAEEQLRTAGVVYFDVLGFYDGARIDYTIKRA
jgi:hypothetical protein